MTDAPVIKSRVHDIEPEDGLLFGPGARPV